MQKKMKGAILREVTVLEFYDHRPCLCGWKKMWCDWSSETEALQIQRHEVGNVWEQCPVSQAIGMV